MNIQPLTLKGHLTRLEPLSEAHTPISISHARIRPTASAPSGAICWIRERPFSPASQQEMAMIFQIPATIA